MVFIFMIVATMSSSDLFPTHFVGTAMAAVQNEAGDGRFRIYLQNKDYKILELSLDSPTSMQSQTRDLSQELGLQPRINTPIGAIGWDDLRQV